VRSAAGLRFLMVSTGLGLLTLRPFRCPSPPIPVSAVGQNMPDEERQPYGLAAAGAAAMVANRLGALAMPKREWSQGVKNNPWERAS
jgi:hypothetical protein